MFMYQREERGKHRGCGPRFEWEKKNETHDPRHFIPHELGGMVAISILHQEVAPQRPGQDR